MDRARYTEFMTLPDILGISPSAIQPTPDVTSSAAQTFIEGVIAVDQQMLRIIDIHQVLPQLPQQDHSQ